jgi:hypothetical protein
LAEKRPAPLEFQLAEPTLAAQQDLLLVQDLVHPTPAAL